MLKFDDFTLGRVFTYQIDGLSEDEIIKFANQWDMQPFHVDKEAAEKTIYGGLIASGFQTMVLCFRHFALDVLENGHAQGSPGLDFVKWLKPLRPNTPFRSEVEVLAARKSKSNPDLGIVQLGWSGFVQDKGEDVLIFQMQNSFFINIV